MLWMISLASKGVNRMKHKWRLPIVLIIITVIIYITAHLFFNHYFALGKDSHIYTFEWGVRHRFLYTWILAIFFPLFKFYFSSILTTLGCFLGMSIGEYIGNIILENNLSNLDRLISEGASAEIIQRQYMHYGVYIWLVFQLLFIIAGVIIDTIRRKKIIQIK